MSETTSAEEPAAGYRRKIHSAFNPEGEDFPDYRPEQTEHWIEPEERDLTSYVPDPGLITPETNLLQPWGEGIWTVDGPDVSCNGCCYTTRMVVVRMHSGGAWVWSPVPFSQELAREIEGRCGGVRFLVAPNQYHHLHLKEWSLRYPLAKIHAPPGLPEREDVMEDMTVDFLLTEDAPRECYCDVDSCLFRGSYCDEAVFFHKDSKTVIFADLIQRHYKDKCQGVAGMLMSLNDVVGPEGSTPQRWRLSWWWNGEMQLAQNALNVILDRWKPERLIVAHGECAQENATEIVAKALSWMNE